VSGHSRKSKRGPRALASLLQGAGGAIGSHGHSALATIRVVWPPLVGSHIASGTQVAAVRGRTLHIRASHAEMARELEFLREHVIRGLEEHVPDARIRSLRVRVEALASEEEVRVEERTPRAPDPVSSSRVEEARALTRSIEDPELRESFQGWIVEASRWASRREDAERRDDS